MKRILFQTFLLSCFINAHGQYIDFASFEVKENRIIMVEYSLKEPPHNSFYEISIRFEHAEGVLTPKNVSGDVGKVESGGIKNIFWDVVNSIGRLEGELTMKLVAELYSFRSQSDLNIPDGLVLIKGGVFKMGDMFSDGGDSEKPVHEVKVDDFLIDETEVTFDLFDRYCQDAGLSLKPDEGWGRGARPAININWYEAIQFCNWRSKKDGLNVAYHIKKQRDINNLNNSDEIGWVVILDSTSNGYRLPTEAEWEYAARSQGQKVRFGNGQIRANSKQMNFDPSYPDKQSVAGKKRGKTVPVNLFLPSSIGLYCMAGNVSEWCFDWYDSSYYNSVSEEKNLINNPIGVKSGLYKAIRGGSWNTTQYMCRTSARNQAKADLSSNEIGFRCVRSLMP